MIEDEHDVLLGNHFNIFNRLMVPWLVINFSSWRVFKVSNQLKRKKKNTLGGV